MPGNSSLAASISSMDITKRFDRILKIFFLLQSKSVVTLEELTDRFGTSERTIYRDLKSLESAGIPVVNETGSGYSIMEGFRMQPSRFSQEEIVSLMVAEKMMQKHETVFIKQHFDAALIKIKSSFRFHQKNDLLHLEDKLYFNENLKANNYLPDVLDVLLNSILKKKIAGIHYIKMEDENTTARQIEPIGVFYESNNWYVLAWCHLRKDYRNFRLDRIKKIFLAADNFTLDHPPINELREATTAQEKTNITVKIDKQFAHNLFWERDAFGFEKEDDVGDEVIMYFGCKLCPDYFVRWFMMFADRGEIVTPAYLRQQLTELLAASLNNIKKRAKKLS